MFDQLVRRVLERTLAIQQIPAPTFEEEERAKYVLARWHEEGVEAFRDPVGNVYARIPGRGTGMPLVVSAHLDTVFGREVPLQVRREGRRWYGPGIGDNSLGVAGLFGLFWALRQRSLHLPGDLYLVANVAEEGLGNLKGMQAVVDRFGSRPRAYIVLEGMALGRVYHRGLGVRRYRLRVRTPGGHAWGDYGAPSALHELVALLHGCLQWTLPVQPKTTFNVGKIHGGRGVNVIAEEAEAWVEWRSEEADTLEAWCRRFEAWCEKTRRKSVEVTWEVVGERPAGALPVQHPLVQAALQSAWAQGIEAKPASGSTDANVPLSRGYPAVGVGLTYGGGAHTLREYIWTEPLAKGLAALVDLVQRVFAWER